MRDFIELPQLVKDNSEIYSVKLNGLLHGGNEIQGRKFSLKYLRDLYQADREAFLQVIDELSLRGFLIITEKPNNILPNYIPEPSSYIVAETDEQRFRQINFAHFGIPGFIDRFTVESDLFFHKLPLEGFKRLNAGMRLEDLEEAFADAGFLIKEFNEQQDDQAAIEDHEDSMIQDVFHENKFRLFRGFCKKNGISTVEEVTSAVLEDFRCFRQVGQGKLRDVKERLEEIGAEGAEEEEFGDKGPIMQIDNPFALEYAVTELFHENKYNKFLQFCMKEDIETVGQIQHEHIKLFTKYPGIGQKRVNDVWDKLNHYLNTYEEIFPSSFESGSLYPYIQTSSISDLMKVYQLEVESDSPLTIADIEGQPFETIDHFNGEALLKLSIKLKAQKPPVEIIEGIGSQLSERETFVLQSRFLEDLTLEETAETLSVTRERIRQIEGKTLKKIFVYLIENQFLESFQLVFPGKKFFSYKDMQKLTGEKYAYFTPIFKHKDSLLSYLPMLDVFYWDQHLLSEISKIDQLINELPNIFYLYEHEEALIESLESAGFENPSIELIGKMLQNCHFHQYGTLYSKYKLAVTDVLEQLFRKHIKEPLRIDEVGFNKLKQLASQHLNYHFDGNLRSVDARLRDTRNVILVDSLTFQWFDGEAFDTAIIHQIEEYLDGRFQEISVVNVEEVFEALEDTLPAIGIYNKHHLYSIIKYFLDEKYSIGKGNTLNIFKDDSGKMNLEETIIDAIQKAGGLCTKDHLEETLKWHRYKIDLTISNSDKLIPWGQNQVILYERIGLTESEKEGLLNLLSKSLTKGYTTAGILYKELMFDPSLSVLISQREVDDHTKLAGIIKALDPGLRGHTNFLYREGCEFTSFDHVILKEFNRESSRQEIREFALEHGYSYVMAASLLSNLLERGLLVEIDYDTLYPASELNIGTDIIQQLTAFIDEQMGGKSYISLNNLKGYRRKLPPIDYRWNLHLMKSLLVNNGFRQIQKVFRDYRYDKVILVPEDADIQTYEELIHLILTNEYDGNMHEIHVYDFLAGKGILQEQMYDHEKILPQELREGSLVSVNEIGIVTVGQG